jgi:hypothetical protein
VPIRWNRRGGMQVAAPGLGHHHCQLDPPRACAPWIPK